MNFRGIPVALLSIVRRAWIAIAGLVGCVACGSPTAPSTDMSHGHKTQPTSNTTPTPTPTPTPANTAAPTFSDNFNTGVLGSAWMKANWPATLSGVYDPNYVDLSQGMLCLRMTQTQNPDGSVNSVGSEIKLNQLTGYGTYQWTARMGCAASSPNGSGPCVSGGISGLFIYNDLHQTEIDFETEGQFPNRLDLTSWLYTIQDQAWPATVDLTQGFHTYKFVWAAGRIDYYLDSALLHTVTKNVPSSPANVFMDHWGTLDTSFGGTPTLSVERRLYISNFSFWAQ